MSMDLMLPSHEKHSWFWMTWKCQLCKYNMTNTPQVQIITTKYKTLRF